MSESTKRYLKDAAFYFCLWAVWTYSIGTFTGSPV